MLGDPVTKPKEYGDIMGYYSRQTCGQMLRTVFTRLRRQAMAKPGAEPKVRAREHDEGPRRRGRVGEVRGQTLTLSPKSGVSA